jgi:hypothetical protein
VRNIDALTLGINAMADMHSLVIDSSFLHAHERDPYVCVCSYGVAIRELTRLRSGLYKIWREERRRRDLL